MITHINILNVLCVLSYSQRRSKLMHINSILEERKHIKLNI